MGNWVFFIHLSTIKGINLCFFQDSEVESWQSFIYHFHPYTLIYIEKDDKNPDYIENMEK